MKGSGRTLAPPPRDELAIERERAGLRAAAAALSPERRAALRDTLERAAGREEKATMPKRPPIGGRKKAAETASLAIRFSPDLLAAVDKAGEQIAKERPDMTVTRSDAIRVLVAEALSIRKIPIR
ncbi:MAG: hypothetical protein EXR72_03805 [Myxococcales bacterium]|nr:hypothetical protein [Myxococcales bacterium]